MMKQAGAHLRRGRDDGLDLVVHRPHARLAGILPGGDDAPGDR